MTTPGGFLVQNKIPTHYQTITIDEEKYVRNKTLSKISVPTKWCEIRNTAMTFVTDSFTLLIEYNFLSLVQ